MERKQAHKLLFQELMRIAPAPELNGLESEIDQLFKLPAAEKEAQAEALFCRLATFTADHLSRKYPG
jgi:hypothetical protein